MFRRILLIFTDPELRLKLLKILLLLIALRLLAHVPIPVLRVQDIAGIIETDAVLGLLNTIAGGAYGRLSFVMLGVGPYITSSIVMQLLGVLIPRINEIQKEEGQQGQQKINRWTRMISIPLAMLQGWGILQFLSSGGFGSGQSIELPAILTQAEVSGTTFLYWLAVVGSLAAGSAVVMWIGEIITEFKMGNGISLIILSGIVVRLPNQLIQFWDFVSPNISEAVEAFEWSKVINLESWKTLLFFGVQWSPIRLFGTLLLVFVISLLLVVFMNDAVRKLVVVYSRRGHSEGNSRTLGSVMADLPIKVNVAGVIPIIFAVSFILFPTIISRFVSTANIESLRTGATQVETFLSVDPAQVARPMNLPNGRFGFYGTADAEHLQVAQNYDTTIGQEILQFTLSTNGEVQNNIFGWKFDGGNMGFLPEYMVYFNGFLAYSFFYFFLIIFFTYFYTSTVAFKTEDVAENLQRGGAYIPGYRPGIETQNYLSYVANRLNVAGSIFLALIALVPLMFGNNLNFGDGTINSIVGGTTLLILVSVTVETLKQMEAQATSIDYERFTTY